MSSLQSLSYDAQAPLFMGGALVHDGPSCPNPQLSCHNSSVVPNTCCFNYPGGQLLQTQFWDFSPATGPADSWTIHGLWPDTCDGGYEQNCDPSRVFSNISDIIAAANPTLFTTMSKYWKDYQSHDASLWSHEWSKHGTCVSTLSPSCYASGNALEGVVDYFSTAVQLFETLNSYSFLADAGIVPSTTKRYALTDIETALSTPRGVPATVRCHAGALNEIWYHFNVRGSAQAGTFVPASPDGAKSNCPSQVKYLPKSGGGGGGGTRPTRYPSATHSAPHPTGTTAPFTGRGSLHVNVLEDTTHTGSGSDTGCLISHGTWYVSGSCATFRALPATGSNSAGKFTLHSSKGPCAVQEATLACGSGVEQAGLFGANGTRLMWEGQERWHAEGIPSGRQQGGVQTGGTERDGEVEVELVWTGV